VDRLDTLAAIHRDPFDRMLVAQALAEECTLVTADSTLFQYGVPAVWE
jgi:PIN domain nuclease of toxin-antitoxin system